MPSLYFPLLSSETKSAHWERRTWKTLEVYFESSRNVQIVKGVFTEICQLFSLITIFLAVFFKTLVFWNFVFVISFGSSNAISQTTLIKTHGQLPFYANICSLHTQAIATLVWLWCTLNQYYFRRIVDTISFCCSMMSWKANLACWKEVVKP